jgi:hypothetical protein
LLGTPPPVAIDIFVVLPLMLADDCLTAPLNLVILGNCQRLRNQFVHRPRRLLGLG